jgi:hypothetical protein
MTVCIARFLEIDRERRCRRAAGSGRAGRGGASGRLRGHPARSPGLAARVHTDGLSRVRGTVAATSTAEHYDLAVDMISSGNPG